MDTTSNSNINPVWQRSVERLLGLTLGNWIVLNPYIDHIVSWKRIDVPIITLYRRFESIKKLRKKLLKFEKTLTRKLNDNWERERYLYIIGFEVHHNLLGDPCEVFIELKVDEHYHEWRKVIIQNSYKSYVTYSEPLTVIKPRKKYEEIPEENRKYVNKDNYEPERVKSKKGIEVTVRQTTKMRERFNGFQLIQMDLDRLITQETITLDCNKEGV